MKKYIIPIDADTKLLESKLKSANAAMTQLSEKEIKVEIDYDHGDIDDIRRAVDALTKYSPELKVQLAYDVISTTAKRKQQEYLENLDLQKIIVGRSPDRKAVSSYVDKLLSDVEDGLSNGYARGPLIEKLIKANDIADSYSQWTGQHVDNDVEDHLNKLTESFKELDKYKTNKNFLQNLSHTIEKDKKIIEGMKLQLEDLQKVGATGDGVSEVANDATDAVDKINKSASESEKIKFFDGIKEQILDVEKDAEKISELFERIAKEWSEIGFRAATDFTNKKGRVTNSLYDFLTDPSDSFGSGTFFSNNAANTLRLKNDDKNVKRNIYAANLSSLQKMVKFDSEDMAYEFNDAMGQMHALIAKNIFPSEDLNAILDNDDITGIDSYFEAHQNLFDSLKISKDKITKFISDQTEWLSKFKTEDGSVPEALKKEKSFTGEFIKYAIPNAKGITTSNLGLIDNAFGSEVLDEQLAKSLQYIDFGGNEELFKKLASLVIGNVLKNKAKNPENDLDEIFRQYTGLFSDDFKNRNFSKAIFPEDVMKSAFESLQEAKRIQQDAVFQSSDELNKDLFDSSPIDEYVSKMERLYQLQQTIANMKIESAYEKSYEESGKYIDDLNARYQQTIKEINKLKDSGDDSDQIKERIGLLSNLALAYQDAIDNSVPNDVARADWLKKYTQSSDDLVGDDALYQFRQIKEEAESFNKSLESEILSTYREVHDKGLEIGELSDDNINVSALEEIPEIMDRINSAGAKATSTMHEFNEASQESDETEQQASADSDAAQAAEQHAEAEEKAAESTREGATASEQAAEASQKQAEADNEAAEAAEKKAESQEKAAEAAEEAAQKEEKASETTEKKTDTDKESTDENKQKTNESAKSSAESTRDESNAFDEAKESASAAASAKDEFYNSNINVAIAAALSAQALHDEADAFDEVKTKASDAADAKDKYEKSKKSSTEKSKSSTSDKTKETKQSDVSDKMYYDAYRMNAKYDQIETDGITRISEALKEAGVSATDFAQDFEKINESLANGKFSKAESQVDSLINKIKKAGDKNYTEALKDLTSFGSLKSVKSGVDASTYAEKLLGVDLNDARDVFDKQSNDIQSYLNKQLSLINTRDKKQTNSGKGFTEEVTDNINKATKAVNEYNEALSKINSESSVDDMSVAFEKGADAIKACSTALESMGDSSNKLIRANKIDNILQQFSKYNDIKLPPGLQNELDEMVGYLNRVRNAADDAKESFVSMSEADFNNIISDVSNLQTKLSQYDKKSFLSQFGNSVSAQSASFLAQYFSIRDYMRYAKEISNVVTQTDSALIELAKVSNASNERIAQSFETSAKSAHDYGATVTDMIKSTADWARLGYSVDQAEELAKVTQLYVNVGDNITRETASESLVSTLKGFQLDTSEAEGVIDKFNEVANNYAIDTEGIGEALKRSASAFNASHTSLDKSIALVTAANTVMQKPESVGTLFNTLSARIRGASIELEELGEEQDDYTKSTSKLRDLVKGATGFDILEEDGKTFKDIYDIILGIGREWGKLDDITRAGLGEALAGKRNSRGLFAVFDNLDVLTNAYNSSLGSVGSARREEERYMESVQFKIQQAKASLEELANDFLSSDLLGNIIQFGDGIIRVLDSIIDKGPSLLNIFAALSGMDFLKGFMGADSIFGTVIGAMASVKTGSDASQNMIINIKSLLSSAEKGVEGDAQNIGKGIFANILKGMQSGYASNGIAGALKGLVTGIGSALGPVGIGVAAALATAGVVAAVKAHQEQVTQELRAGAKSASEEWDSSQKSLNDYINKYSELKNKLDSGTLSEQETLSVKQQILEIQNSIVEAYGSQASGIDLVNGGLQEQLSILDSIAQKNATELLRTNAKQFEQNKEDYENPIDQQYLSTNLTEASDSINNLWNDFAKEIKDNFDSNIIDIPERLSEESGFDIDIKKPKNAQTALETYEKLLDVIDDFRNRQKKLGNDEFVNLLDTIYGDVSDIYTNNSKSWQDYVSIRASQRDAELAKNGGSKIERDYKASIDALNKAATSGTQRELNRARKDYANQVVAAKKAMSNIPNMSAKDIDDYFRQWDQGLQQSIIKGRDLDEIFGSENFKKFVDSGDTSLLSEKNLDASVSSMNELRDNAEDIYKFGRSIKNKKLDKFSILSNPNSSDWKNDLQNLAKALNIELNIDDNGSVSSFLDQLAKLNLIAGDASAQLGDSNNGFSGLQSTYSDSVGALEALNAAMAESVSGAGMSAETISNLKEKLGDDLIPILEKTENGYHLNTKALSEYQQQNKQKFKSAFLDELDNQYKQLNEIDEKLKSTTTADGYNALMAQRNQIVSNIKGVKDLMTQYEAFTSEFQQWRTASSNGNERDMYTTIFGSKEEIGKLLKDDHWFGDDVRTWLQLMTGDADMLTASYDDLVAKYDEITSKKLTTLNGETLEHTLMDYYTVDKESGRITSRGISNFFKDVEKAFGKEYYDSNTGNFDFTGEHLQTMMDQWGIGKEVIDSIVRAATEAGFEAQFESSSESIGFLGAQASKAKDALGELGKDINLNPRTFDETSEAIENVQKKIDSLDPKSDTYQKDLNNLNAALSYLVATEGKYVDVQKNLDEIQKQRKQSQDVLAGQKDQLYRDQNGRLTYGSNAEANQALRNLKEMINLEAQATVGYNTTLATLNTGMIDDSQTQEAMTNLQQFQDSLVNLQAAKIGLESGVTIQADVDSAQKDVENFATSLQELLDNKETVEIMADLGINTDKLGEQLEVLTGGGTQEEKDAALAEISSLLGGSDFSKLFELQKDETVDAVTTAADSVSSTIDKAAGRIVDAITGKNKNTKTKEQENKNPLSSLTQKQKELRYGSLSNQLPNVPTDKERKQRLNKYYQTGDVKDLFGDDLIPLQNAVNRVQQEREELKRISDDGYLKRGERDTAYWRSRLADEAYQKRGKRDTDYWRNILERENTLKQLQERDKQFDDYLALMNGKEKIKSESYSASKFKASDARRYDEGAKDVTITPTDEHGNKITNFNDLVPEVKDQAYSLVAKVTGTEDVEELQKTEDGLTDKTVEATAIAIGNNDVDSLVQIIEEVTGKSVTVEAVTTGDEKVDALIQRINLIDSLNKTYGLNLDVYGDEQVQQLVSELGFVPEQTEAVIDVIREGDDPSEIKEGLASIAEEDVETTVTVNKQVNDLSQDQLNQSGTVAFKGVLDDSAVKKNYQSTVNISANMSKAESSIKSLETSSKLEVPVDANTTDAMTKIDEVIAKEIPPKEFDVNAKTEPANKDLDALDKRQVADKSFSIYAHAASAFSTISSLNSAGIDSKSFTVSAIDNASSTLRSVKRLLDSLTDRTFTTTHINKTVNQTVNQQVHLANGTAHSSGTAIDEFAHATGTAHARGNNWSLPHDEANALINELGTEIIVRDGQWFTVNDGYPTFTSLKKGDIIFNHKQTEELLKNGYVTGSHARMAYASGTVLSGPAHASKGSGRDSWGSDTGTGTGTGNGGDTGTGSGHGNGDHHNPTPKEDKKDPQEFDWIETLRNRLQSLFDKLKTLAEYYTTFTYQNKALSLAMAQARKNITENEKAANKYKTLAYGALKPLGAKAKKAVWQKIQNGTLRIEEIDNENIAKAVQKAQELYEKYLDCNNTVDELRQANLEFAKQKLDNIIDDYEALTGYAQQMADLIDTRIEYRDSINGPISINNRNKLDIEDLKKQAQYQKDIVEESWKYVEFYQKQINQNLKDNVYKIGSQEWVEAKTQLAELKNNAYEAAAGINAINNKIFEINWQSFEKVEAALKNANDQIDNTLSLINGLQSYNRNSGKINMNGIAQFDLNAQNLGNARQAVVEYDNAINKLGESLKNGLITQDQYNEKLDSLKDSKADAVQEVQKYRDAIIDLIKKGINAETNAMSKLIDKQKELLRREKEERDYKKTVDDKTKEINRIRAQIAALDSSRVETGSDKLTLENQARVRQLQEQLTNAQNDLEETQKDHEYDQRMQNYDKELKDFKEMQDEKTYILESDLYKQGDQIRKTLDYTTSQYSKTLDELNRVSKVYGIELEKAVVGPWEKSKDAAENATKAILVYKKAIHAIEGINRAGINQVYHEPTAKITTDNAAKPLKDKTNDTLVESGNASLKNNSGKTIMNNPYGKGGTNIPMTEKKRAEEQKKKEEEAKKKEAQKKAQAAIRYTTNKGTLVDDKGKSVYSYSYGQKLSATGKTKGDSIQVKTANGTTGWIKKTSVTTKKQTGAINTTSKVYSKAGSGAKQIGTITKDTKITIEGERSGNYTHISYVDPKTKKKVTGWVASTYTQKGSNKARQNIMPTPKSIRQEYLTTKQMYLRPSTDNWDDKLATIPAGEMVTGKAIDVNGKWVKVTYAGKTGWLDSSSMKKVALSSRKFATTQELPLRPGINDLSKELARIPANTLLVSSLSDMSGRWANVSYEGQNGWVDSATMKKVDIAVNKYKTTKDLPLRVDDDWKSSEIITVPAGTSLTSTASTKNGKWILVKYNGKKGWIDSTSMNKAAKGARNASGLYLTDEEGIGSEMMITKSGVLRQLDSDTVFSKQQTDMLWNLSKLNLSTLKGISAAPAPNVNLSYGSMLTVNGNVDRDALPGLQEILRQACDYTKRDLKATFRKIGINGSL